MTVTKTTLNIRPILLVEGARNCGKTYLIDKISSLNKYKFPFAKYYNEAYSKSMEDNSNSELFYFTAGYDVTLFDMHKQGLIENNLLLDRGFLSNIVLGIQSKRITKEQGINHLNYILNNYGDSFKIVYITAPERADERNKDAWEIYKQKETIELYDEFLKLIPEQHIYIFQNTFEENARYSFFDLIMKIYKSFY